MYEKERVQRGRKKIVGITFSSVYHSGHRDKLLTYRGSSRELDLSKVLIGEEIQVLLSLDFTEQELKNNYLLLNQYSTARKNNYPVCSIIEIVKYIKTYPDNFRDFKAYMIGSLRTEINKHGSLGSILNQKESLSGHAVALSFVDKISHPKESSVL